MENKQFDWNKYQTQYKKDKYKQVSFYLSKTEDKELLDYLMNCGNIKQTIVKALKEYIQKASNK